MQDYKWYMYRKIGKDGSLQEMKRKKKMFMPRLFGWKLVNVIYFEVLSKKK